jgi:hypothetical protein
LVNDMIYLADSFVSDVLGGVLGAATFRPAPGNGWDLRVPVEDPAEANRLIEEIRSSFERTGDSEFAKLALQYGLTVNDEELDRLTLDDQFIWNPTQRRAWLLQVHDTLYPNTTIPPWRATREDRPCRVGRLGADKNPTIRARLIEIRCSLACTSRSAPSAGRTVTRFSETS